MTIALQLLQNACEFRACLLLTLPATPRRRPRELFERHFGSEFGSNDRHFCGVGKFLVRF